MKCRTVILLTLAAGSFIWSGCSSVVNSHLQKETMMTGYMNGNTDLVLKEIDSKLKSTSGTGDELMWVLEAGSMNFNLRNYPASIEYFRKAEQLVTEYDDRAMISLRDSGSEALMAVTNLNALPYRGFCRDRILLSFFKALAYLGENNEEAFSAQLRRMRDEQKKVMEDYQKFFDAEQEAVRQTRADNRDVAKALNSTNEKTITSNVDNQEFMSALNQTKQIANHAYGDFLNPAALFLSALGSLRDNLYDNAVIDFRRFYEAMPANPLARQYYVTALKLAGQEVPAELAQVPPFDFPLNSDCVHVIFANGRGPAFRQVAIYLPVMTAWPVCEYYQSPYSRFRVIAGGKAYDSVQIADMDAIISQEYNQRLPGMITRIVISTAIKEAAHYTATALAAHEDELAGALVFAGGLIYKMIFNTADTRSWEILPKEFQLTQFPMPPGRKFVIESPYREITLPENYRSAIIYVNTPSRGFSTVNVFGFNSK